MSPAQPRRPAGYWLLVGALALALFGLGTASDGVFTMLTRGWVVVLQALGLHTLLDRLQQDTSPEIAKRSLLVVATYAVGYLGLCLLLLRLLLGNTRHWALALRCYGGAIGLCVLLLVLGKLSGFLFFYKGGRRLIDFIVSPLPVIILLALLSPALRRPAVK